MVIAGKTVLYRLFKEVFCTVLLLEYKYKTRNRTKNETKRDKAHDDTPYILQF